MLGERYHILKLILQDKVQEERSVGGRHSSRSEKLKVLCDCSVALYRAAFRIRIAMIDSHGALIAMTLGSRIT